MKISCCKKSEDVKLISELAEEIYFEHYTKLLPKDFVAYWVKLYQSYENIMSSIDNGEKYFWLKDNNALIGYFSYILDSDNKLFVSKLYIKSSYRNKGYGMQCLNYLYNIARNEQVNEVYLKTMRENPSVKFYLKNGFIIDDYIETDLGNNYILKDYILAKTIK